MDKLIFTAVSGAEHTLRAQQVQAEVAVQSAIYRLRQLDEVQGPSAGQAVRQARVQLDNAQRRVEPAGGAAQQERPGDFICVAGYGDGATGYIPTEAHWAEHDSNLGDWCWVAPGSEARMREVIRKALHRG